MKGKQGADGTAAGGVWAVRWDGDSRPYYTGRRGNHWSPKQRRAKRLTRAEAGELVSELWVRFDLDGTGPTAPRPVRLVPRRPLSALTVAIASLGLSPAVTKALSGIAVELTAAHRDALETLAVTMDVKAAEWDGLPAWPLPMRMNPQEKRTRQFVASTYAACARMVREAASAGAAAPAPKETP